MATYVLVHGSYQGGWIWQLVGERLVEAGHRAYRPTLEGSAERRHHPRADLTLADHGAELADYFFFEDLQDVILVGTSIGGMVVCETAPRVRERIRRLVFIDALVPVPGESVPTINSRPPHDRAKRVYAADPETIFAGLPGSLTAWARA